MKKILMVISLQLLTIWALRAQDCATGYCPKTLTVHHKINEVAPMSVDITYEVVESTLSGDTACWIARNLGATAVPTYYNNYTTETVGWFWQFNRKQGYYLQDVSTLLPDIDWATQISEDSDWLAENDPCRILLGSTWRIPTATEYDNVIANGNFVGNGNTNFYTSELKLLQSAYYSFDGGVYDGISDSPKLWSSTQSTTDNTLGTLLFINPYKDASEYDRTPDMLKIYGFNLRCIRSYR